MNTIVQQLIQALTSLDLKTYFVTVLNLYFPYGFIWWGIGLVLFIIAHLKTRNLAFAGALVGLYFVVLGNSGLVTNLYSQMFMKYIGLILGVVAGFYLYRSLKGG